MLSVQSVIGVFMDVPSTKRLVIKRYILHKTSPNPHLKCPFSVGTTKEKCRVFLRSWTLSERI